MDNIKGTMSPRSINVSGVISQKVLQGLSAYEIAVANGFEGTQTQWLQSLRGEHIQFMSDGLTIYYKYESDEEWTTLVQIDKLMTNYSVLDNKPSINDVELDGNKTLDELGIQAKGDYVEQQEGYGLISDIEKERLSHVDNYDDSEIRQAIEAIILNAVTGVKGAAESVYRKGDVNITPANIGLGNVDNTHDADKNVLSAVQDSEGNVFGETYFNAILESDGETFLVRPDGTSEKLMVSEHTHDASEITSGTIDIARLPAGALDRLTTVDNRIQRYALTRDQVQNGDTVQQLDTGVMYRVVDDTQLNRAAGYKEYTAGRASAVPWSGIQDKPETYTPSSHTHEISDITDIAEASVHDAEQLKTPRFFSISGGATAQGVSFDGTGNVVLVVTALDASLLSGTADIDITGNAATATQFARERTIEVTGKATAAPKVYDGRQNIALEITDLDAAEKNHTHTVSDITDLDIQNLAANTAKSIADFATSNTDTYSDVWFSDPLTPEKPVHNSGIQFNPVKDTLKVGNFQGALKGNADSASALTTDAGSATQPVYFLNGVPVATTHQLNTTVPANAVFTDTHYASKIVVAGGFNAKEDTAVSLSNGNVYLNHIENGVITSSRKITGTGSTTVTADEHGNLIINATEKTYTAGSGISISNDIISNAGVRSISESTERGNITANIDGTARDIPVHGLKSAAYTDSSDYATAGHKHSFSELQNKPTTIAGYGITDAASATHGHDASEITSGTIDIARLPAGALEKLVPVANETERYALTKAQVQNGDTVQQEDTGVMYRVVDENNLDKPSGYKEYVAGAASSVPWSGITGKPESFPASEHTHTISDISDITTATVAKADKLSTARTITLSGAVTGSADFDGSENVTLNAEVNHTHQYAGSQTIGGAANSAVRLETSSAGSSVIPVYFYEGKPVALDYQLNKTVPANAEFTDTHYSSTTVINSAEDSTTNSNRAISNGNVFINHIENGEVKASHRIEGTGSVTVTYDDQGDLIINGTASEYSTLPNPHALSINGYTYDGSQAIDVGVIDVAHGGTGSSAVDTAPTQESSRMVTSGGVYAALEGKAAVNHTHQYAGSSTSGGSANSAERLNSNAGSSTQPVYFSQGKPVATDYEVNASVPANAVFTDTHHTSRMAVTNSSTGTTDADFTIANGAVFLNHVENGEVRSSHRITGSGDATVRTDSSGNIIINAESTKYTALPNPFGLTINGKTYDGSAAVDVGVIDVAHGGTGNSVADTEPIENSTKFLPSGAVYTALQGKADASHTHPYAGSSTAGGSATSAVKLDSNAGSATQPVYFTGGKPTATTHTLEASVPANAVFTDTHYASKTVIGGTNDATEGTSTGLTNTHVFVNHVENGEVVSSHRISGTGSATVTTDASGNILVNAEDTKYTALPNPHGLSVNGKTYDGSEAVDVGVIDVAHGGTGNSSVDTAPTEDSTKMVTSGGVYTALEGKADAEHTHSYAGSSTPGGSATSAVKLDSNAGSITQPIYFSGGKPTATTHTLESSVPANAVFTDTHHQAKIIVGASKTATSNTDANLANGSVFLNLVENGDVRSSHRITGSDAVSVTTDTSGNIVIAASDTKYTALPNPHALTIKGNGTKLDDYDGTEAVEVNITPSNIGAAATNHNHAWDDITNHPTTLAGYGITDSLAPKTHGHDASEISSGVLDIARIPVAALERLIPVADGAAMYALTVNDVQLGDTVQREDTGVMYRVIDIQNLDNAAGYREYVAGAASSVPWQGITGKPETFTPSAHTHQYAGSSTAGGSANSAVKLDSDAGSTTQPIYFSGGKPTPTTHTLEASVPANAKFTDTHYESKTVVGGTNDAVADTSTGLTNSHVFVNHVENGEVVASHSISGTGSATVTTDASGNILINAEDTKYTTLPNPYALSINGKSYDGSESVDVGVIDVAHGGTGNSSVDSAPTNNSTKMVTSGGVYTALEGKSDNGHTHLYAGSSTSGGSATSAVKLDSNAGSLTQPVYFSGGKPTATSHTLEASVPANAVFTDTHYASKTIVGGTNEATVDTSTALANTHVFVNHVENGAVVSSHTISGSGATTVTTDSSGNIIVASEDTKYTSLPNPYSLSINGKTYNGSKAVDVGVIDVAHGGTGNSSVDSSPIENSTKMVTSGGVYDALAEKAEADHTHPYAGASTSGGSATSAAKLDTESAGSATTPVYFTNGKPTAISYSIQKSVPSNAVFTDTHHTAKVITTNSASGKTQASSALSNGQVFLNVIENNTVRSSHKISGGDNASVTTDASGNIVISAIDTKYTSLPNPYALTIKGNGTKLDDYNGTEAVEINITPSNIGAAASSHAHPWADITNHPTTLAGYGITDQLASKTHIHDASEIQSGVFDIARIPVAALERLISVANLAAMYRLTTSEVQLGDTVQLEDTGVMYRVVDTNNLDNELGYKEYTAGTASSAPWSGITGKPSTFPPSVHTHQYAGSSTAGGSANSAVKLDSDAGSTTQPVYFSGGKPVATTYSLGASVPANAVFTDTHHQAKNVVGGTTATSNTSTALANGNVYLNLVENGTVRSSHKISGSGATTVKTDTSGNIIISSTDNDTKYTAGTGLELSGTEFSNTGVLSIAQGSTNGAISVNTGGTVASVSVHGLGTAAYKADTYFSKSDHTHKYAGSSTAGGSATSAVKLDTSSAGSATQPVYFSGGKPVSTTYYLNATVPANAVFTDTHYTAKNVVAGANTDVVDTDEALSNGSVFLNLIEDGTVRSAHKISGSGATTVTTDASGNIVISSTDSDTKYSAGTGISITGTTVTNTGVRAVSTGSTNGTISVNTNGTTENVAVKGLGSAAYTDSSAYATAGHTHSYAGSASSGGSATSAVKLDTTTAGSATQPVYFTGGKPEACTYELNKTVPSNAVFTDTHHQAKVITANTASGATQTSTALSNGSVFLNVIENNAVRSSHKISGSGATTVTTDASGNIVISSTDSDTKYSAGTGINITGTTVTNTGVRAIDTGSTNGTISVNTNGTVEDIAVNGLGSAAYTNSSAYATASHTHSYAGASSSGGSAISAVKLDTTMAGTATQPVYFSGGKPVACTYSLNKTVPSDAVFTDTHHTAKNVVTDSDSGTADTSEALSNGEVFLNLIENGSVRSTHQITGSGATTVTTNASGNIIISSTNTDTKYTGSNGITLTGTNFTNSGVRAITTGTANGTIRVDTNGTQANVAVYGLGSAAYTDSSDYATADHTHNYAGSSTVGGSATSAVKLDTTTAGSATQPVYFTGGKPEACTYSLNKTVPSNAVFTDTHHTAKLITTNTASSAAQTTTALSNGSVFLNVIENNAIRSSHKISGSGATTVTTDASGNIVISSTDSDTKYSAGTGIDITGTTVTNTGVRSISTGSANGTISVDTNGTTEDIAVKGLGSAAYTNSSAYATAGHTHAYAGASSSGGSATSAVKLDTATAGSATQPVYFTGGKPVACTYELNKTVPSNAVFTDTHHTAKIITTDSATGKTQTTTALSNGSVYLNVIENSAVRSSHKISGGDNVSVMTDASGNIVISAVDTKYTNLPNPYTLTIKGNGTKLDDYNGSEAVEINITPASIGAAASSHTHPWSNITNHPTTLSGYGITDQLAAKTHIHDASEIQSGVLDIARIPVAALERLISVANLAAMYKLTTSDVQLGDTVQLEDTGVMYRVVDTANLDNELGYKEYTAGTASSAPWSGITGKPSTFPPSTHTHQYAGSSTAGGSANSAVKLDSDAGSATKPIYFSGGKPVACTYELNKTVPSNAVFTDTHHTAKLITVNSATGTTQTTSALSNGSVYLNVIENNAVRSSHKISGSGATTVTTDSSGNIVISSTDSDTKYSGGTGIDITGTTVTNTGVRSVATGSANGTISVNTNGTTSDVAVKGLGSAAYTASSDYATAGHTHKYAGSSTAGGSATSAVKLDTSTAGTATQPVYFSGGKPVACTYELNKTVPSNAVFTDTHHQAKLITTSTASGTTQTATALSNGSVFLNVIENSAVRSSHKISGSGATTVTADTSGNIIISSTDTDTKYSGGTGIDITGNTVTNTGVRSIDTGSTNGTISVNTNGTVEEVAVKGLGSAAYTASTAYAAAGHTHSYAGSSSAGGSATSAVKLDTATAGSATQPVYFSGGKPTACTYSLNKTVPSDAVFTDTHHTAKNIVGASATATANAAATNGNVYLNLIENSAVRSAHKIVGTGLVTVVSDSSGNITVATTATKDAAYTGTPSAVSTTASAGSSANYARGDHVHNITLATGDSNGQVKIAGTNVSVKGLGSAAYTESSAYAAAGAELTAQSADTSSKIFLIGAASQTSSAQKTYSDNEVYTTSGVLTTKSVQVGGGAVTMQYNSTTKSLDFIFA